MNENHIELIDVTPPTLKQRVAEAAERDRRAKIRHDSMALENLLLTAEVITIRLPSPQFKAMKDGQVRFDLDGVAFDVYRIEEYRYDDQGQESEFLRTVYRLRAHLICTREGCNRTINWPYADNVRKLADLNEMLNTSRLVNDARLMSNAECSLGARHGDPTIDHEADELAELPW